MLFPIYPMLSLTREGVWDCGVHQCDTNMHAGVCHKVERWAASSRDDEGNCGRCVFCVVLSDSTLR